MDRAERDTYVSIDVASGCVRVVSESLCARGSVAIAYVTPYAAARTRRIQNRNSLTWYNDFGGNVSRTCSSAPHSRLVRTDRAGRWRLDVQVDTPNTAPYRG